MLVWYRVGVTALIEPVKALFFFLLGGVRFD